MTKGYLGIDIGSTTVKVVVLDEQNKLLFRSYERHYSKTRERACETLRSISDMLAGRQVKMVITAPPDWEWPTPPGSILSRRYTPLPRR